MLVRQIPTKKSAKEELLEKSRKKTKKIEQNSKKPQSPIKLLLDRHLSGNYSKSGS